jgi:hypothetical protein
MHDALNGTAKAVLDNLIKAGDKDDCFVVVELQADGDWAHSAGVQKSGADWLAANI